MSCYETSSACYCWMLDQELYAYSLIDYVSAEMGLYRSGVEKARKWKQNCRSVCGTTQEKYDGVKLVADNEKGADWGSYALDIMLVVLADELSKILPRFWMNKLMTVLYTDKKQPLFISITWRQWKIIWCSCRQQKGKNINNDYQ